MISRRPSRARGLLALLFLPALFAPSLGASPGTRALRAAWAARNEEVAARPFCGGRREERLEALRRRPALERALALRTRDQGEWSLPVARLLARLSENAADRGACAEARDLLARAHQIFLGLKGSEDAETVTLQARLADTFRERNRAGRATHRLREAWHRTQAVTGPYDEGPLPEYQAIRAERIATTYYRRGEYARAVPLFQRALKLWLPHLGPDHPRVLRVRWRLAKIARKRSGPPEHSDWPADYVRACNNWQSRGEGHPDGSCSSM